MRQGRVFALVGASGVGKDTILAALSRARPALVQLRRIVTRPARLGDECHDSLSPAAFASAAAAGAFALSWQAHGLSYGLPASALARRAAGEDMIFNGSRAVLGQAAQVFPGLEVLELTASPAALAARLEARGRETPAQIGDRLARAGAETLRASLPPGTPCHQIANDGPPDQALAAILALLDAPPVRA